MDAFNTLREAALRDILKAEDLNATKPIYDVTKTEREIQDKITNKDW